MQCTDYANSIYKHFMQNSKNKNVNYLRRLGPLHTWANSRDHEIVRAQKKVSKRRPKTSPKSCSVVTDPQVSCEAVCDRDLNQMLI